MLIKHYIEYEINNWLYLFYYLQYICTIKVHFYPKYAFSDILQPIFNQCQIGYSNWKKIHARQVNLTHESSKNIHKYCHIAERNQIIKINYIPSVDVSKKHIVNIIYIFTIPNFLLQIQKRKCAPPKTSYTPKMFSYVPSRS